jgi:eukaryotic-like serine/threonine-protein kinase
LALFANRYEQKDVLGRGHFGRVWRAFDNNLGLNVALKLFKNGTDIDDATYEAKKLMLLRGPHILPVLNADKYQDIPFVVTYIAEAGTADTQANGLGVSPAKAISWLRDMLVGLDVCHSHRLLHRDVKASNIFLRSIDEALLGDFGLVAEMDVNGNAPAHGFWSIRAPECFVTDEASVLSDIYSAGLSLYQLLAGFDPFIRTSEADTIAAVKARDYRRIREEAPHTPRVLAMRLEKAMADNPADRYQSAAEFHAALGDLRAFPVAWSRRAPHPGHHQCWNGRNRGSGQDLIVCVTIDGLGFRYETRKATGSQQRVLDACGSAADEQKLRVALRRVFDVVS